VEIPFHPVIGNFSVTNLMDALLQGLTQHTSFTKQKPCICHNSRQQWWLWQW